MNQQTTDYELKIRGFEGPLGKLLELIEAKKLEITEFSLAEVTVDFLNYLKTLEIVEPRVLADFVTVAARLVLIKSKALIPALELNEEEEKDIKDLENRLGIYKELRAAKTCLKKLYESEFKLFSREFLGSTAVSFYPPQSLESDYLAAVLEKILNDLGAFSKETDNFKISVVSLEEKMDELSRRLAEISVLSFKAHVSEKSKTEAVTLFLAVLHLLKDQAIRVEQESRFADIMVHKI